MPALTRPKNPALPPSPSSAGPCRAAEDAAAGTNTITLAAANIWTWSAGDYVFIYEDDVTVDVVQVQAVAGLTLTLTGNLTNTWSAPWNIWPLLFGKFASEKQGAMSAHLASWSVTIEQLANQDNAQVGVLVPPPGTGIGADQVGISNPIT